MMEETLLELVREYEELYDMANKKYSDASHKDRIWTRIALELDKTGEQLKPLTSIKQGSSQTLTRNRGPAPLLCGILFANTLIFLPH